MQSTGAWTSIALVCSKDGRFSSYVAEMLRYCGLFFEEVAQEDLLESAGTYDVLILSGPLTLLPGETEAIGNAVLGGSALLVLGATSGLETILGVEAGPVEIGEGYLQPSGPHAILDADEFPIHIFGGGAVRPTDANDLGTLLDVHGNKTLLSVLTLNKTNGGVAIFFGGNLGNAALRMRQGRFVDVDGIPAPDGTAPLEDGTLRTEDGLTLDWHLDRSGESETDPPAFMHPQFDRLRAILFRSVLYCAEQIGKSLAVLWLHPRNAPATGMISFNSDGRDPQNAVSILHQANLVGLRGTWCVQHPGYHSDVYRVLRTRGNEIAVQYDPTEGWDRELLKIQSTQMVRVSGSKILTSVRTRQSMWRGRNDLYEWATDLGFSIEIGRGPFHLGTAGFVFGTCHPFRPIRPDGGTYGVTSVPYLVHNPGLISSSTRCLALVDAAVAAHGIVHFNIDTDQFDQKPVSEAFRNIVAHGRGSGVEWQTGEEIALWHRGRRQVRHLMTVFPDGLALNVTTDFDLMEATILMMGPPVVAARANELQLKPVTVTRFGFQFNAVTLDLPAKRSVEILFERRQERRAA